MAKAQLCPVCGGSGKKVKSLEEQQKYTTATDVYETCHGCGGSGWVTVRD